MNKNYWTQIESRFLHFTEIFHLFHHFGNAGKGKICSIYFIIKFGNSDKLFSLWLLPVSFSLIMITRCNSMQEVFLISYHHRYSDYSEKKWAQSEVFRAQVNLNTSMRACNRAIINAIIETRRWSFTATRKTSIVIVVNSTFFRVVWCEDVGDVVAFSLYFVCTFPPSQTECEHFYSFFFIHLESSLLCCLHNSSNVVRCNLIFILSHSHCYSRWSLKLFKTPCRVCRQRIVNKNPHRARLNDIPNPIRKVK